MTLSLSLYHVGFIYLKKANKKLFKTYFTAWTHNDKKCVGGKRNVSEVYG